MKSHIIAGGGGVPLHVVETGAPAGRSILFIHGFSQCCLAWSRQLDSELAADRHLIAMDLRGHGLSGKPRDGAACSSSARLPRMLADRNRRCCLTFICVAR